MLFNRHKEYGAQNSAGYKFANTDSEHKIGDASIEFVYIGKYKGNYNGVC